MIKLLTVLGLLLANPILGQKPQNVRIGGKNVKIGEKTWLLRDATPAAAYVPVTAEMMKAGFWKYFVLAYNKYGYLKRGYEHKDRFPERDSFPVCLQNGYIVHNLLQGETATPASDYPHLHRIEGAPLRSVIMQNGNKQENIAEENIQYSINEILCDNTSGIWLMKSVYNVMIQNMDPAGITINPVTVVRKQGETEDASLKEEVARLKEENDRLKKELEDALDDCNAILNECNTENGSNQVEVNQCNEKLEQCNSNKESCDEDLEKCNDAKEKCEEENVDNNDGAMELENANAKIQRVCDVGGLPITNSNLDVTFYYFHQNMKGNQKMLKAFCKSLDLDLAKVLSDEEWNFLKLNLPRHGTNTAYALDGHKDNTNDLLKGWTWSSTGQKVDKFYWHPGQPNENNGVVLCIYHTYIPPSQITGFNDWTDHHDYLPLCEKRNEKLEQCNSNKESCGEDLENCNDAKEKCEEENVDNNYGAIELEHENAKIQRVSDVVYELQSQNLDVTFYYFHQNMKGNQKMLKAFCKSLDLDLAKVLSDEEWNFLKLNLPPHGTDTAYALDGHKDNTHDFFKGWTWLSTGQKIDKFYWHPNQPNENYGVVLCIRHLLTDAAENGFNDWTDHHDYMPLCEKRN